MKQYAVLCLIVAIIMLITPTVALIPAKTGQEREALSDSSDIEVDEDHSSGSHEDNTDNSNTISVFLSDDEKTEEMDMRDYVIGVVAAEMPASYETEALRAQALVAVTYACYSKKYSDDENSGADISDDSSRHQGYMTTEQMKEKWGDAYESYYNRIADAVDTVIDSVITYEGEPVMAAYHAISSGKTESALNLWGKDIPYLQSTDSEWDKYSSRYSSEVVLTARELKDIFSDTDGTDFSEDEENWIKINTVSESGTVLEIEVGGVVMSGMELRELVSLRSPVFTVEYSDGEFVFTVSGYGHGVGMSQNGANAMAKEGKTYKDIISHYYKGVKIEKR